MSKITEAAKGKRCTARLPGICNYDNSTSIWSHINSIRWGAGRGHKAPDICGLITCNKCADVLDRRVKTELERDYVMQLIYEGHMESLMILWEEGII